jgi:hypothetical protein
MAGTPDVTTTYESKTELDFRNRLVAKFQIPSDDSFWDVGFEMIPESALYPPNDRIKDLCLEIGTIANEDEASTEFGGQLLVEWGQLEEKILPLARKFTQRNVSVPDAIRLLTETGTISDEASRELNIVRRIRNATAHTPTKVTEKELNHALELLRRLTIQIGPNLIQP